MFFKETNNLNEKIKHEKLIKVDDDSLKNLNEKNALKFEEIINNTENDIKHTIFELLNEMIETVLLNELNYQKEVESSCRLN